MNWNWNWNENSKYKGGYGEASCERKQELCIHCRTTYQTARQLSPRQAGRHGIFIKFYYLSLLILVGPTDELHRSDLLIGETMTVNHKMRDSR